MSLSYHVLNNREAFYCLDVREKVNVMILPDLVELSKDQRQDLGVDQVILNSFGIYVP